MYCGLGRCRVRGDRSSKSLIVLRMHVFNFLIARGLLPKSYATQIPSMRAYAEPGVYDASEAETNQKA